MYGVGNLAELGCDAQICSKHSTLKLTQHPYLVQELEQQASSQQDGFATSTPSVQPNKTSARGIPQRQTPATNTQVCMRADCTPYFAMMCPFEQLDFAVQLCS